MLRYTIKRRSDGLEVRFHQFSQWLWQIPLAVVPLGLGTVMIWYFARRMGHQTTWGVFIDIGIEGVLVIAGALIILGLRLLMEALTTSRFLFRADGIGVRRTILGLRRETLWYPISGIYAFGRAVRGHSREPVLKFAYPGEGDWVVMAHGVDENDASSFLEVLRGEGYEFSSSWDEPARPSKALNFVTGL
jgi:hypothetical protein